ncbi:hypothetical protein ICW40_13570 [Actinotalea ferrariae]|uniref:hypothetical protein n=1 Tax=Actinotalea ferrariae TaxID=1386098 RepID=UPI001C8C0E01|nr:hypothetical protein [Actinotalea ferrariae]MBX9245832.1 hypothetical protein [Actinotalea ferrariae]
MGIGRAWREGREFRRAAAAAGLDRHLSDEESVVLMNKWAEIRERTGVQVSAEVFIARFLEASDR